ncbi:hypothetical protein M0811_06048 [Anaeramoeba ignava]|uniref:Fibronectin type-III domain-containing protein n=1 Tax=Anaeramoeba ignava TaxID=1746090 RepID=A0A9Q0LUI1_ANAIG|nr:hypothetical protein M0811_06048 [Anaeramoeba ignava]
MKKIIIFIIILCVFGIVQSQKEEVDYLKSANGDWYLLDTFSSSQNLSNFGWSVDVSQNVLVISNYSFEKVNVYRKTDSNFILEKVLNQSNSSQFGKSVAVSGNVIVIGAPGSNQSFIYRHNGTDWNLNKVLNQSNSPSFGSSVAVSTNVTVIGAPDSSESFIYRYDNGDWYLEKTLNQSISSQFGKSVSVSTNVTVIGAPGSNQSFIYRHNGSDWNIDKEITQSNSLSFGSSVAVSKDVTVIGAPNMSEVFIYRYDGIDWNNEKVLTQDISSQFGKSVSVSTNVTVIGAPHFNQTFIYRYDGSDWNNEKVLNETNLSKFGRSVSIATNYVVIGAPSSDQVFLYQSLFIPQVDMQNCSSLYSSFSCYWDKIDFSREIVYQINYGSNWTNITSPNVQNSTLYQNFTSSNYHNISGNVNYSIQIRGCDNLTMQCGDPSSFHNLTTRIDSIKNFKLKNRTTRSFNVSWDIPDVPIKGNSPNFNHYTMDYKAKTQATPSNLTIQNSTVSQYLNQLECGQIYSVSMWACGSPSCQGDDQGEVFETRISTFFEKVENFECHVSEGVTITCDWIPSNNCSNNPYYYNFTYRAKNENDTGNDESITNKKVFIAEVENEEYEIQVSSCDSNGVCGEVTTLTVTTSSIPDPTPTTDNKSGQTTTIVIGVFVSIMGVGILIIGVIMVKKYRKARRQQDDGRQKINDEENDLEMV